jgi:hypothetical protein
LQVMQRIKNNSEEERNRATIKASLR